MAAPTELVIGKIPLPATPLHRPGLSHCHKFAGSRSQGTTWRNCWAASEEEPSHGCCNRVPLWGTQNIAGGRKRAPTLAIHSRARKTSSDSSLTHIAGGTGLSRQCILECKSLRVCKHTPHRLRGWVGRAGAVTGQAQGTDSAPGKLDRPSLPGQPGCPSS